MNYDVYVAAERCIIIVATRDIIYLGPHFKFIKLIT